MIKLTDLSKKYGVKKVVSKVNLSLTTNKLTAIIGPNGAGKSTLLAMISRLVPSDTGEIFLDHQSLKTWKQNSLAKKLSLLKQASSFELKITVKELVEFGRFPYSKGHLTEVDHQKVNQALAILGLKDLVNEDISTLSGGQLQRAYIALVLAQDTDYILLDEPLNNLDMKYEVQIMKTLRYLVKELGKTIIIVIHDLNFAASYADEIIAMKNGKIFKSGLTNKIIDEKVLSKLYEIPIQIQNISGKPFCLYFN